MTTVHMLKYFSF